MKLWRFCPLHPITIKHPIPLNSIIFNTVPFCWSVNQLHIVYCKKVSRYDIFVTSLNPERNHGSDSASCDSVQPIIIQKYYNVSTGDLQDGADSRNYSDCFSSDPMSHWSRIKSSEQVCVMIWAVLYMGLWEYVEMWLGIRTLRDGRSLIWSSSSGDKKKKVLSKEYCPSLQRRWSELAVVYRTWEASKPSGTSGQIGF